MVDPLQCPACGYVRQPKDAGALTQCPSCNVVFSSYKPSNASASLTERVRTPWRPFGHHPLFVGVLALTVFALAWAYGSFQGTTSSSPPRQITPDQRNAAQVAIRFAGYRCDSLNYMGHLPFKHGFRVTCNDDRYAYEIVDEGGRWVVRLD